jgi:hypothetical protein
MLNVRSDECGRVFCYRENGTGLNKYHIQVKNGRGKKYCSSLGLVFGRLNSAKYIDILENRLLPAIR